MSGYPMIDALNAAPTPRETADHAELARLAEAATPGPWVSRTHGLPEFNNVEHFVVSGSPGINEGDALVCTTNLLVDTDAAFIAAANPAAVLALLSEIAALRGERDKEKRDADNIGSACDKLRMLHRDERLDLMRRATQAERQRDELRKALERIAYTPDGEDGLSLNECVNLARNALANQGADQ